MFGVSPFGQPAFAASGGEVVTLPLPVATINPIVTGTPRVGFTLSTTDGVWENYPLTFARQWQRSEDGFTWHDITGATSSTYLLVETDRTRYIRSEVTATNLTGSATAYSNAVGRIEDAVRPFFEEDDTLGCGTYQVLLLSRGGREVIGEFPWTTLDWQRVLDDTSQATVHSDGCPETIPVAWRHEIGIYRDNVLVWAGPVYQPKSQQESDHQTLDVIARDLSAWWDRRLIHEDHDYAATPADLATIFNDLSTDAMRPDNSPGLTVVATPTGITGVIVVTAAQKLQAGTQLRQIADAGVDWTAVAREIVAGGTQIPTGNLGTLTDESFVNSPTVSPDGSVQTNKPTVIGSGTGPDGNAIFADAVDADAVTADGLLETVDNSPTLQDYNSIQAAASSELALAKAPVVVTNAILSPDAPITIEELVTGATCRLELVHTLIPVSGDFRLQQVDVNVSQGDGQLTEQVVCTFQPEGGT